MTFEEWAESMIDARDRGDTWVGVTPLTFGRARIVVGEAGTPYLLDGW